MKRSNLYIGFIYALVGFSCLLLAVFLDSRLASLLFGFAGAGLGAGVMMLCRYFYWSSAKHKETYAKRLEQEQIELHDERKERLRDRSGRFAYLIGLVVIGLSSIVISVLGYLEVAVDYQFMVSYLGVYFIFQYLAGVLIFRHLNNKY